MTYIPKFDAPITLTEQFDFQYESLFDEYPELVPFYRDLGNTDMIEVPSDPSGARIFAKIEWQNPEGSVKDRVAFALIADLLQNRNAEVVKNLKILEYSGGNLSVSLSRLCNDLRIPARFVLSSGASQSLLDILDSRHATYDLVDKSKGFYAVVQEAIRIAERNPEWHFLYQHRNMANIKFHEFTTASEIIQQLQGVIPAAWISSIGTGGSLIGVANGLIKKYPDMDIIGVTPAELPYGSARPPNGLPKYAGSGGMGNSICQPFVESFNHPIQHCSVSLPDCLKGMVEFKKMTGLRIGTSAAANWIVSKSAARRLPKESSVITMFPDAGSPEEWRKAES